MLSLDWNVITIMGSVLGFGWLAGLWVSSKFSQVKALVFDQTDKIITKLEYHEKHDDQRFADMKTDLAVQTTALKNDIWEVRLRNASRDREISAEKVAKSQSSL